MKKDGLAEVFPPMLATVTTHLPNLTGYHAGRLEVVRVCLESMRRTSGLPVMVWDNGSCKELTNWLVNEFKPEYLILSPNVGKMSARRAMCGMFPPETIAGFTDDDMLFYPGWFEESLKLLTSFPNAGAVSAWPIRISFDWATSSTIKWAKENALLETGRWIPITDEIEYAKSVGISPNEHVQRVASRYDCRVIYKGLTAYATAQHCQFIAYVGRILPYCDYSEIAMKQESRFDSALDDNGLLRLTTIKKMSFHMGNDIQNDIQLKREIAEMGLL